MNIQLYQPQKWVKEEVNQFQVSKLVVFHGISS
jgi:hypothetical protein